MTYEQLPAELAQALVLAMQEMDWPNMVPAYAEIPQRKGGALWKHHDALTVADCEQLTEHHTRAARRQWESFLAKPNPAKAKRFGFHAVRANVYRCTYIEKMKIPREEWPKLTVAEIIAKFNFDHIVFEAIGGPTAPHNLDPILKEEHQAKTPDDLKAIAKGKRIQRERAAHADTMARKSGRAAEASPGEATHVEPGPDRATRARSGKRSRSVPGSRDTPYRKKFNGRTELRHAPAD